MEHTVSQQISVTPCLLQMTEQEGKNSPKEHNLYKDWTESDILQFQSWDTLETFGFDFIIMFFFFHSHYCVYFV